MTSSPYPFRSFGVRVRAALAAIVLLTPHSTGYGQLSPPVGNWSISFRAGKECIRRERLSQAVAHFTETIARHPGYAPAYQYRAACRFVQRDFQGAIVDLTLAIPLDDKSLENYWLRANAHRMIGEHAKADLDNEKWFEISTHTRNPKRHFGAVELDAKRSRKDDEDVWQKLEWDVRQICFWRDAWNVFSGAPLGASRSLLQSHGYKPTDFARYGKFALSKAGSVDFSREIRRLAGAIQRDADLPYGLFCLGLARANGGELTGAMKDFDAAIRLKPDYEEAYVYRGLAHAHVGELKNAIRDYSTALRLSDKCKAAYLYRSHVYLRTGDEAAAIRDMETFLGQRRESSPSPPWNHLGN